MLQKLNLKVYSEKVAKEILKALKGTNTKELQGEGRFKVIASCESIDRDGEVIMVDGWDFTNYQKNPVILWGHNYWDMNAIIGACDKISVEEIEGVKCLVMEGMFAKNASGQEARQLYDTGFLKTVSVGFIPKERNGNIITKQELLELSFCGVPSNPDAISLEKFAQEMMTKTLTVLTEDPKLTKGEGMDALVQTLRDNLQTVVDNFVESMGDDEGDEDGEDEEVVEPPKEGEEEEDAGKRFANMTIKKLNKRFLKAKDASSSDPKSSLKTANAEAKAKIVELEKKIADFETAAKSGRVLSAKNIELVDAAIAALKALRDASEPEKAVLSDVAKEIKVDSQALVKMLEGVIKNAKILTSNL